VDRSLKEKEEAMPGRNDHMTTTRLDENLHRPRLKEGIVPADTRVYVRVMAGPDKGKVFDLSRGGSYVVGRRKGDIPLSDDKVSNRHAELKILGPEAYFVVDLASTNGTFLNGRRIDRQQVQGGEEIRVGDSLLQLSVIEQSRPLSKA
jgi:pSer/pThr/pTyr-binding forkhead associated (FHA) protein